jgi:hypothetical protein
MQDGVAVVKLKPDWASVGAPAGNFSQHFWFVPVDPSDKASVRTATISTEGELIQEAYKTRTAFRCGSCKTVVLIE